MKLTILALIALTGAALAGFAAPAPLEHFITARDAQLLDGEKPFRFLSMNIPNLLLVEDNVRFAEENPWRLPDSFEINDALATVAAMGGTVTRTYVISVQRTNDLPGMPRHVLAPGKFNEAAFRTLDEVLAAANRTGVRLIIPLVDNWPWMGGRAQYAGFRGKTKDDFWTDPQLIADFKQTIRFVLTRTNTVTGVRYGDDKSVLCWETGNEVESPAAWTREIAHYIKTLDANHLVMDGFNANELRPESLEISDVDIVTTHHYPGHKKSFAELIRANAEKAKGKKTYVVGEFGFVSTAPMTEAITAITESSAAGGLLWSLRFRNRDGGLYWHSEPGLGANLYKAFHWPGSPIGNDYDETSLLTVVRNQAFAIRGLPVPAIPAPAPPTLLPTTDAGAIAWQGSVGANGYLVERANTKQGPWTVAGDNVDESFTQYRPQFSDEAVTKGNWFYRVSAKHATGVSAPSNVIGPVTVARVTLVDELADFAKVHARLGALKIESHDCRSAMEDAHRAGGQAGSALVYRVASRLSGTRVFVFFPKEIADLKFGVSADGATFRPTAAQHHDLPFNPGDYGYWRRAIYEVKPLGKQDRFMKIEFTGEAQISRVEIQHDAK